MDKLKILVAGADSTTSTVIGRIVMEGNAEKIYALPYNELFGQIAELVDIRENDINGILEFVTENKIDLTIVTSPILIANGIANIFEHHGKNILAPYRESAIITYFNAAAKKTMYKLKIPTPKFAIFDKCNNAVNFIRQMDFPLYVSSDFKILTGNKMLFNYFSEAKRHIEELFFNNEERVVIEEYTGVNEYNIYFLTDGYSAIELGSVESQEDGITVSPACGLPENVIKSIKTDVVDVLLADISKFYSQYKGILGVKVLYDGDIYKVTDFMSNFENCDLETILPNIRDDFVSLLYSAATGSLTDEYSDVRTNDIFSCSLTTTERENITKLEVYDGYTYMPLGDGTGILTTQGSTVAIAKEKLTGIIEEISENNEEE